METQVVKYDINTAAIAEMADLYMKLTITDLEDKEQFDSVHSAQMVVRGHRVSLDKAVKGYNDQANAFKKKVKADAAPLYEGLNPIEAHLKAEKQKVIDEQDRIQEEEDRKEREKVQARIDKLQKYDVIMPFVEVAVLSDDEFENTRQKAEEEWAAAAAQKAKEQAEREAEEKRLAEEKRQQAETARRLEQIENEQAEARAKIEADRKALEDEKKAEQEKKDREEFERKAAEDAKLKAEQDAKDKAEREEAERFNAEQAAKKEAERIEKLRPDKERLQIWISDCEWNPKPPDIESELSLLLKGALQEINDILNELSEQVERR